MCTQKTTHRLVAEVCDEAGEDDLLTDEGRHVSGAQGGVDERVEGQ